MSGNHSPINSLYRIWKLKIPPRVMVFNWLVLRGGILTKDNLCRHRKIIVNACPMCLADEESIDHLLWNCKVAQGLWSKVLSRFHCSWAHPRSICGLLRHGCWRWDRPKEGLCRELPSWRFYGSYGRKGILNALRTPALWLKILRTSSNSPSPHGCPSFLNFMGFLLISFWEIGGRWSCKDPSIEIPSGTQFD